ncbi:MAG TPA: beta-N-acetylhexosaminidase [Gemmatimonadaceae bacterium]
MNRLSTTRLAAALTLACSVAACNPVQSARGPIPLVMPPPLTTLSAHRLVPTPVAVSPAEGVPFALTATTSIVVPSGSGDAQRVGGMLAAMLRPASGFVLPETSTDGVAPRGAVVLRLGGPATLGPDGYELAITSDSVRILAVEPAGLFHGVQTFRQLLPAGIEGQHHAVRMASAWTVPPGTIVDHPRFAWRGAMLDVARHFFTVYEVKQYIDLLAMYKMNTLHLHLSDDQGWRIQIDSWPKLTTVGGITEVGGGPGGFYTKDEYAELVRFAGQRFITIVPEIDMPGHTHAAIASYPELGCSKPTPATQSGTPGTYTGTEVGWSTLCPDKEVTYRFVEDVVREISAMTPGAYFHVGGDEVQGLTAEQYSHFVERTQEIVYKYGKTMVGWEEVGKARLRPTSIAQQWKSDSALLALRQGAKLIASPAPKAYLDMKYTPTTELGLDWAGLVELRTAYNWDPVTYLPGVTEQSVVGVEAPLWTETVQNITAAQYMTVPRLPAIAEVGWSPASERTWDGFRARIAAHAPRWRLLGINFYPSPQVDW